MGVCIHLKNTINEFYFNMTINELRLMNSKPIYPDITYNSLLYVDIISYKKNCTVSFLADALHISKSAVTIKVNELMKQGFVTKTQSKDDKRMNYLAINESIAQEHQNYNRGLNQSIQIIQQNYSQKEIDTFCEILKKISDGYLRE